MTYGELFFSFAKIGFLTFGGGYAMLPLLQKECVENKKWVSDEELLNYYAIGQCTPGIIAVNTATFIGTKEKGICGGIIATLGVVFPSFLIITILASVISVVKDNVFVQKAFAGIRLSVCALILSSLVKLVKKAKIDVTFILVASASLILQLLGIVDSVLIVIGTIVISLIVYLFRKKK